MSEIDLREFTSALGCKPYLLELGQDELAEITEEELQYVVRFKAERPSAAEWVDKGSVKVRPDIPLPTFTRALPSDRPP
eukprot:4129758-Karenia_brevis.AAC.1